jgi:site-specific recombinase XerD
MDAIEQLFIKFDGAFARNTIRAYRSDFADFKDWCLGCGIDPMQSQPENWVDYIEASMLIKSTATVTRRINSLATIF